MKKIILGFAGPLASGKGTAAKYIVEKYNGGNLRFSTILRDILDRVYLPHSRGNMQTLSTWLRETFGQDVMTKTMAIDASNDENEIVAIDGVRRLGDIKSLVQLPNFYLVSIDADIKTRFERLAKRGENPDDNTKTFEQFAKENEQESEQQIKEVQEKANFQINNNGTVEDLYRQIDDIIAEIRGKSGI